VLGWHVLDVYADNDLSAYSGKRRPEYERLRADLQDRRAGAVLAWHTDRLHRSPQDLETFISLCDAHRIEVRTVRAGELDLSTPSGRVTARLFGAMARYESEHKAERQARKALELAQAGKVGGGGTRAYGYALDRRTVVPDEAVIVREAATRILAGDSLRSLANDLNARGIHAVKGGAFSVQVLKGMLVSARISGQREHHGEIVAPAEWLAIITPAQTARLRVLLNDPERRTNRTPRRYLLAGLLACGRCSARLVARPRADGARRYMCAKGPAQAGCGRLAVLAEPVEQWIADAVLYRLDTPELADALAGKAAADEESAASLAELAADGAQRDELARAYGDRAISLPEWLAARKPIEARIEAHKRRLARATRTSALDGLVGAGDALRPRWADLPVVRQRAIIAALLDRATVAPAVRGRAAFDPSHFHGQPLRRARRLHPRSDGQPFHDAHAAGRRCKRLPTHRAARRALSLSCAACRSFAKENKERRREERVHMYFNARPRERLAPPSRKGVSSASARSSFVLWSSEVGERGEASMRTPAKHKRAHCGPVLGQERVPHFKRLTRRCPCGRASRTAAPRPALGVRPALHRSRRLPLSHIHALVGPTDAPTLPQVALPGGRPFWLAASSRRDAQSCDPSHPSRVRALRNARLRRPLTGCSAVVLRDSRTANDPRRHGANRLLNRLHCWSTRHGRSRPPLNRKDCRRRERRRGPPRQPGISAVPLPCRASESPCPFAGRGASSVLLECAAWPNPHRLGRDLATQAPRLHDPFVDRPTDNDANEKRARYCARTSRRWPARVEEPVSPGADDESEKDPSGNPPLPNQPRPGALRLRLRDDPLSPASPGPAGRGRALPPQS
jgi:DNA invertase Pin-like site-specific DNA recombinase